MSQQMSRAWLPKKSASGEAHDASGHVGKNYKEKTNDECHGLNVNRLCGPSCSWTGRDVNSVSTSFNIVNVQIWHGCISPLHVSGFHSMAIWIRPKPVRYATCKSNGAICVCILSLKTSCIS